MSKYSTFLALCAFVFAMLGGELPAAALSETILHGFLQTKVVNDGSDPNGMILGTDGNFYGTTYTGGSTEHLPGYPGQGTVYKMTPAGIVTILHNFGDGTVSHDGFNPNGLLIEGTDGNFYGTTYGGTYENGIDYGEVFKITPSGVLTILHRFGDGTVKHDGAYPDGLIQGSDGNLYGITSSGGSTATSDPGSGEGTFFQITPAGTTTILRNFTGGFSPNPSLIHGSDSNFYGTSAGGGTSAPEGSVFELTTSGTLTTLYKFIGQGKDGMTPLGGLVLGSDGNFYGTTSSGGINNQQRGTVFKLTPAGKETILHSFDDGAVANDAMNPTNLIQGADGNFYGTSTNGGSSYFGTIFEMTPSGVVTILHNYGGTPNNYSVLVQGGEGIIYGTTTIVGASASGSVFSLTPAGTYSVLHSFLEPAVPNDGAFPAAKLLRGSDGNFYGTTPAGGSTATLPILIGYGAVSSNGKGTVFKMTPTGLTTVLHSFGDGTITNDGSSPQAELIEGTDGNFYGTASSGGVTTTAYPSGGGVVYKITPLGVVTVLHKFQDGTVTNDGAAPLGGLLLGSDGNVYGTTSFGGASGAGTVFKMTPAGGVTILHSFLSDGKDGNNPAASLIEGTDENFYGTTESGGTTGRSGQVGSGFGTAFKVTPKGVETVLHSFAGNGVDGATPTGGLVEGLDGNFYGTTYFGITGSSSVGTIFKVTSTGVFTNLHDFGDGSVTDDGAYPKSGLILAKDGNFYGTTALGGSTATSEPGGYGTLFEMTPAGAVSILHSFNDRTVPGDGNYPLGLIQTSDEAFYGMTAEGGLSGVGTVFQISQIYDTQKVTFPSIPDKSYGMPPFALNATASSGLPITYTSTGPVSIRAGIATITGVGTVRIRATQAGDAEYEEADVLNTFTVTQAVQTITFPTVGNQVYPTPPITLNATSSSGLTVTYNTLGPAKASGNVLTITGTGTVIVAAHQAGNTGYAAAPEVRQTITVGP